MPTSLISKYAKGLVKVGFDTLQVLPCCTVKDLMSAGVSKGHALQLMNSWDSGSSSGSSSDSSDSRILISSDSDVPAPGGWGTAQVMHQDKGGGGIRTEQSTVLSFFHAQGMDYRKG